MKRNACFAAESTENIMVYKDKDVNSNLTVMSFNEALSSGQQWTIDEGNRIVHSSSGLCLISKVTYTIFGNFQYYVKAENCSENEGDHMIFEPILKNGVPDCGKFVPLNFNFFDF